MTMDIVKRLRTDMERDLWLLRYAASDEIERLRAEVDALANLRVERNEFETMRRDKQEALEHYSRVRAEVAAHRAALANILNRSVDAMEQARALLAGKGEG